MTLSLTIFISFSRTFNPYILASDNTRGLEWSARAWVGENNQKCQNYLNQGTGDPRSHPGSISRD